MGRPVLVPREDSARGRGGCFATKKKKRKARKDWKAGTGTTREEGRRLQRGHEHSARRRKIVAKEKKVASSNADPAGRTGNQHVSAVERGSRFCVLTVFCVPGTTPRWTLASLRRLRRPLATARWARRRAPPRPRPSTRPRRTLERSCVLSVVCVLRADSSRSKCPLEETATATASTRPRRLRAPLPREW